MKGKAFFLDRDGVIVIPEFRDGRSYAPRLLENFCIYPEAGKAMTLARSHGYKIIVITNQPDINNNLINTDTLNKMHNIMKEKLDIDWIEVCPHTRAEKCKCRKPSPTMIQRAAEYLDIDTSQSFMIGDRHSDIEAGFRAGCKSIFIDRGYTSEDQPTSQNYTCKNVLEAINWAIYNTK